MFTYLPAPKIVINLKNPKYGTSYRSVRATKSTNSLSVLDLNYSDIAQSFEVPIKVQLHGKTCSPSCGIHFH